jgi:DNA-binding CsgD family transcriptional regulator
MPHSLTLSQYSLARMYASGLTLNEMTSRSGITYRSVESIMRRLRQRLGVTTRGEMAALLLTCRLDERAGGRSSTRGYVRGGPVRITGGRFDGRDGVYVGHANSVQIRVQVGGGVFALRARFCQPMEKAA